MRPMRAARAVECTIPTAAMSRTAVHHVVHLWETSWTEALTEHSPLLVERTETCESR